MRNIYTLYRSNLIGTPLRGYDFAYDDLNRLLPEDYFSLQLSVTDDTFDFGKKVPGYDKQGNILSLVRYGRINPVRFEHVVPFYKNAVGKLAMTYNGNLDDGTPRGIYYGYDSGGMKRNVTHVTSTGSVLFPVAFLLVGGGAITGLTARYLHTTIYCGNVIYESTSTDNGMSMSYLGTSLDRILTEEGYVTLDGNTPVYHYFLKDHLGNVRVVMSQDGETLELRNDYYPFGGIFNSQGAGEQPYKFGGKEFDPMHGLNWYDFSARMKDSWRFTTMDPLCEKYYSVSPYAYCGNNPVNRIDPTGMIWNDIKEAERLKYKIDQRIVLLNKSIAKNQTKLEKGELSDKQTIKLEGKISEAQERILNLNISKADIDILGADQKNVYTLSAISGGEHKVRHGNDGKIYIETSSDALSMHEITHVRQSLNSGGLKFSSNGELLNAGQSVPTQNRYKKVSEMEVEAYRIQYSYDLSFPGITKNLQGINIHSVGNINNKGLLIYPYINAYSKFVKKINN